MEVFDLEIGRRGRCDRLIRRQADDFAACDGDATGRRLRTIPFTPGVVKAALAQ